MQTDEEAARVLAATNKGDAYNKQLEILLRHRKEAREAAPIAASLVNNSVKKEVTKPPDMTAGQNFTFGGSAVSQSGQQSTYAIVMASYNFRHLPRLSDKTKEVATALFDSLVGASFNRCSLRGSKLLINPSVVEFQAAMGELELICAEEPGSSFFLFVSTHGARVAGGPNAGSYMLFSESRLSSEEELLLTAVHERELARMIHAISCKNKFTAVELCQLREPTEKVHGEANNIHFRIEDGLSRRLYEQVVQLQVARLIADDASITDERVKSEPALLNIVVMESCDIKSQVPLRFEDGVSNFLCRFNDAFRGGAVRNPERFDYDECESNPRRAMMASEVLSYVDERVQGDAARRNDAVRALYLTQVRTKYERAAEFEEISHSPLTVGTVTAMDFQLGVIPDTPPLTPSIPTWVASTLRSITMSWSYPATSILSDLPTILGFDVQIRGCGRASESAGDWKTAAALQVVSYEQVARQRQLPPTQVTAHGLSSDTAYCFRVRALTAGGWGPLSAASPAVRTQSATSATDAFSMVKTTLDKGGGVSGLVRLMLKHGHSGAVQRQCVEALAKLAITVTTQSLEPARDLPAVLAARDAMTRFKKDRALQRHGCMLSGRLAVYNASWRGALLSIQDPSLLSVLTQVRAGTPPSDQETLTWCDYALRHLSSFSGGRRPSKPEAARRIQGLYRRRKAREQVQSLASTIYQRFVDPASGQTYYYNTRTGTASWSLPSFTTT